MRLAEEHGDFPCDAPPRGRRAPSVPRAGPRPQRDHLRGTKREQGPERPGSALRARDAQRPRAGPCSEGHRTSGIDSLAGRELQKEPRGSSRSWRSEPTRTVAESPPYPCVLMSPAVLLQEKSMPGVHETTKHNGGGTMMELLPPPTPRSRLAASVPRPHIPPLHLLTRSPHALEEGCRRVMG